MSSKISQDLFYMPFVVIQVIQVNQDIIQVDYYIDIQQVCKNLVHQSMGGYWGISQPKRYYKPHVMSYLGYNDFYFFISFLFYFFLLLFFLDNQIMKESYNQYYMVYHNPSQNMINQLQDQLYHTVICQSYDQRTFLLILLDHQQVRVSSTDHV